ncbi:MAG: endolytic transglycosylase MltG [Candidatus Omnitrophota bacterium]|nr:endolytic transglycosylase MltG [Candidatus Omnitrophota bacterium]
MRKKYILIIVTVFLGGLLLFLLAMGIFLPSHAKTETVRIAPEMTLMEITNHLSRKGLLRAPRLFIFVTKISGKERKLKAGLYEFPLQSRPFQALRKLVRGETAVVRITIPEGWSAREIGNLLESKELCTQKEFLSVTLEKKMEGFLFPNTYLISSEFSAAKIALTLVDGFNSIWKPEWDLQAKRVGLSQKDVVTLSSIIEREAQVNAEKSVISSVFHNRLRRKMQLEADPTILYALGSWSTRLTRDLLRTKSPYNTYLHRGLPPGPICNPGEQSIKAALYPARTDYLFFVAVGDGTHVFSRTSAGHNAAIREIKLRKATQVDTWKSP